jgi:dihydroflavonol-4-reductase
MCMYYGRKYLLWRLHCKYHNRHPFLNKGSLQRQQYRLQCVLIHMQKRGGCMDVFITGATGFIGRHVARHLVGQGHHLTCLVRKTSHIQELEKLGTGLVWGDVRDRRSLLPGMSGCDALIHLAGATSFWEPDRKVYADVNVNGTRNVMECALKSGVSRVIHMSTLHVYGKPAKTPFNEESLVGPRRFSEYARTKHEGERIAWGLFNKKNLPLTVCYPGIVLGPGRAGRHTSPVKRLIDHTQVSRSSLNSAHTYTCVQDIAEVISGILGNEGTIGRKYFIANERMSTRRLLTAIREITGVQPSGIIMPDWMAMLMARTNTWMAGILRTKALPGVSPEYLITDWNGLMADGSKVQQELGITYTPMIDALKQEIESSRMFGNISERRRARRYPINAEVVYKAQGDEHDMTGKIADISESGMLLLTRRPCPKGRYISASLSGQKSGEYFLARGRVVRRTKDTIAIDFTHRDRNVRSIIPQ